MTARTQPHHSVSLEIVLDPGTNDPALAMLLTQGSVDIDSFHRLEDRRCLADGRTLAKRCVTRPVCLTAKGDAFLIVISGRAEFIPLAGGTPAELVGEGQARRLEQGASAGLRPSSGTETCVVVEISAAPDALIECPERLPEIESIPPLRDYYYGYSDRYATVYAAGAPLWEPPEPNDALVHALDVLDIEPCPVIDLGCGEGRDSTYLAGRGFDVVGVDVARPALTKARERAAASGVAAAFLERDICVLADLPRARFALAVNMGCLHMLPDSDLRSAHLRRVHELLVPDGLFLVAHCRERWLDGFFSVPDYESVGPVIPGRVIPRRIRLEDGGTTDIMLPLVPYKESPTSELIEEICAHGFALVADLSSRTAAFGSTTVLALRKSGPHA
ncbi:class I SAM-dependent methyltransferase [Streptomyces sp. LP05-1]|uniref:Class I SAM-dependent methyltransferase n=1 Tax=Streptomyces pyxinae TaxID=2970734 RepID=A0ABT2CC98_9ACTN|nr:class I SAM-dependent methyltransferase [Streptomyces sp. LP05-1]MCS0634249.1 class I SAM-dependent methyltransferase [Streptomyces sp. LP05-1]